MAVELGSDLRRELYRLMLLTRRLDAEAIALQRQGELVAFPPLTGQEAAQVGSALALRPTDYIFPSYRELGAAVARGVDLIGYLQAYRGHWNGGLYDPKAHHFAPISSSVGSHVLHAVGWALGRRKDGFDDCALAYFGEGACSEGDVHEAMNFAGVFAAPVIFFVQNNGWAISVPSARQTAGEIWKRAAGYGFTGLRIDGNDAEQVYLSTAAAAERARLGEGPTLIEAMTYRVGAHSTADDPSRYREPGEVAPWQADDPLDRLRSRLESGGAHLDALEEEVVTLVAEVRAKLILTRPGPADEMFEFAYARPPDRLLSQRRAARELGGDG